MTLIEVTEEEENTIVVSDTSTTDVSIEDDGTYYILKKGATKMLKIRKADGYLLIEGGLMTDETL